MNGDSSVLMGYKGQSVLDAGYFYAPYIPITSTPVVLDPASFPKKKGLLTRYPPKKAAAVEEPAPVPTRKKVFRSIDDPWEPS